MGGCVGGCVREGEEGRGGEEDLCTGTISDARLF